MALQTFIKDGTVIPNLNLLRKESTIIYQINKGTKALIRTEQNFTKVLEEPNEEINIPLNPLKLIDKNCQLFGSSLVGRKEAVSKILNSKVRLPIPVYFKQGIFLFPTTSDRKSDCVWIAYYHVDSYVKHGKQTIVYFNDKTSLPLNISYSQLDTQYKRTSQVIAYFYKINHMD